MDTPLIEFSIDLDDLLSRHDNYCRLTVPPMIWVGFQGIYQKPSMLLNIANIEHSPAELDKRNLDEIEFDWWAK